MQMGQEIPKEKEEAKDSEDLKLFKEAVDKLEESATKEATVSDEEEEDPEAILAKIQEHQEILAREGIDASPMVLLRRKELELRGELLEIEKKAELKIASARREAAKIRAKADENAVAESKKHFAKEIEKAKKKAEARRNSVKEDIKLINSSGQKNLDKATKIILKAVVLVE